MVDCGHTDILSPGRRSSYPVSSAINAIPKGEGVIIFAADCTPRALDSCNCRLGCTRRYYMNLVAEKFLSLQKVEQLNSYIQETSIHHPKS